MKVKKGDEVVVIAGKDRGVKGTVISVDRVTRKVVVEGVNRVTKHTRVSTTARGAKSGGIEHVWKQHAPRPSGRARPALAPKPPPHTSLNLCSIFPYDARPSAHSGSSAARWAEGDSAWARSAWAAAPGVPCSIGSADASHSIGSSSNG